MNIIRKICELLNFKISQDKIISEIEKIKFQNGLSLLENFQGKQSSKIIDYEFQVFSQWGEDGIISYLVNNVDICGLSSVSSRLVLRPCVLTLLLPLLTTKSHISLYKFGFNGGA